MPGRLVIAAVLARGTRATCLSTARRDFRDLAQAPSSAPSLRRQRGSSQLRRDLEVVSFAAMCNAPAQADDGVVDATLLALAGLKRLGLADAATAVLSVDDFLPAVGQGIIAIETRADDAATRNALATIAHADTRRRCGRRAFLGVLDGSCRTPIAGTRRGEAAAFRSRQTRRQRSLRDHARRCSRRCRSSRRAGRGSTLPAAPIFAAM